MLFDCGLCQCNRYVGSHGSISLLSFLDLLWENGQAYDSFCRSKLCYGQGDYGNFPPTTSRYKTTLLLLSKKFTNENHKCRVIKPGSERISKIVSIFKFLVRRAASFTVLLNTSCYLFFI